MSTKKKNDFNSLGNIYGDILNKVKTVNEAAKVDQIGEAPLTDGGPSEKGGFVPAVIDRRKLKGKKQVENIYNIDKLSEEDEEGCKHAAEGCKCDGCEECEANQKKSPKTVKKESVRINTFMRKKSVFDKLYENVMGMGQSSFGSENAEDLDALGLDDAPTDGEEDFTGDEGMDDDSITLTLDRDTATKLHDMLASVLGGEEDLGDEEGMGELDDMDDMEDMEDMESEPEEDEEELGHAGPGGSAKYNDGKKNKVGNLKVSSGGATSKVTDKVGDDGDLGHAGPGGSAKYNDGKNPKVGNLKHGKSMFEQ